MCVVEKQPILLALGIFPEPLGGQHELPLDDEHNHHISGIHLSYQSTQIVEKHLRIYSSGFSQSRLLHGWNFYH